MVITQQAMQRLRRLLIHSPKREGFSFEGCVGTCRASAPILKPVDGPGEDQSVVEAEGIKFYTTQEYARMLAQATMDYEGGFLGRGLYMEWPHQEGGCPNCSNKM